MLKKIYFLPVLVLLWSCSSTVKAPATTKITLPTHKTVAIVPFEIYLGTKLKKINQFTETEIQELKRYISIALQGHLYEILKTKQKRFPFTVSMQSADITNNILSSKKISFAEIFSGNKKDICRILGVDAIISSKTILGKEEKSSFNDVLNKGSLESFFCIYDSISTEPIWKYNKTISDNMFKDITKSYRPEVYYIAENKYQEVLIPWISKIEDMFGSFAVDFPYKKK